MQIHAANRFFGDVEVMAFHLFAFAVIGPAIELLLEENFGR
jgi:hypothetical protein